MNRKMQHHKFFLVELYHRSRPACIAVLLYLVMYGYTFSKKMDMVLFPFNAMFAYERPMPDSQLVYRVRLNEEWVSVTHYPYWKKDILETSLGVYARYVKDGYQTYMHRYLAQHSVSGSQADFLVPAKLPPDDYLKWWLKKAGICLPSGKHSIDIWQCRVYRKDKQWRVYDAAPVITSFLTVP